MLEGINHCDYSKYANELKNHGLNSIVANIQELKGNVELTIWTELLAPYLLQFPNDTRKFNIIMKGEKLLERPFAPISIISHALNRLYYEYFSSISEEEKKSYYEPFVVPIAIDTSLSLASYFEPGDNFNSIVVAASLSPDIQSRVDLGKEFLRNPNIVSREFELNLKLIALRELTGIYLARAIGTSENLTITHREIVQSVKPEILKHFGINKLSGQASNLLDLYVPIALSQIPLATVNTSFRYIFPIATKSVNYELVYKNLLPNSNHNKRRVNGKS